MGTGENALIAALPAIDGLRGTARDERFYTDPCSE